MGPDDEKLIQCPHCFRWVRPLAWCEICSAVLKQVRITDAELQQRLRRDPR
jgi:hypothetical protein